ncbi:MAG: hypothetical protein MJK15_00810 [Colwellia sp.]|nr:hypothetical protein [Colwellia sp.]
MSLTRPATFKTLNVKALVQQLDGVEPAYPVYYFGKTVKFERPEVPGQEYRWARDNPID